MNVRENPQYDTKILRGYTCATVNNRSGLSTFRVETDYNYLSKALKF